MEENSVSAMKVSMSENKNAELNSGNFITFDNFDSIAVNVPVASTSNPVVAELKTSFPVGNFVPLSEVLAKADHIKLPKICIKRNALSANQGEVTLRKLPCPQITVKKMVKLIPGGTSILKPISKDIKTDNTNSAAETNEFPMCKITDVKSILPTYTSVIKTDKSSPVKTPSVVDTIELSSSDDDEEDKINKDVPKNEVEQPAVETIASTQDYENISEKNTSGNGENSLEEETSLQPSPTNPPDRNPPIKLIINERSQNIEIKRKKTEVNQTDSHKKRRENDKSGNIAPVLANTMPLADQGEKPSKNKEKLKIKSSGDKNLKETIFTSDTNNQATTVTDKPSDDSIHIQEHSPEEMGTALALDDVKQMLEYVEPKNEVNNAVEVASEHKDVDSPAKNSVYIMSDRVKDLGYIIGTRMKDSKEIKFSFPGSKEIHVIHEQSLCKDLNRLTSARIIFVPRDLELKWMIIDSPEFMTLWSPMKEKHLDGNHVLSNSGLHKMDLRERCDEIKTAFNTIQSLVLPNGKTLPNMTLINMAKDCIKDLQKKDQDATKTKKYLKKCILRNRKILNKTRRRVEAEQKKRAVGDKNKKKTNH